MTRAYLAFTETGLVLAKRLAGSLPLSLIHISEPTRPY